MRGNIPRLGHDEDFVPQNIPLKKGEEELQH